MARRLLERYSAALAAPQEVEEWLEEAEMVLVRVE